MELIAASSLRPKVLVLGANRAFVSHIHSCLKEAAELLYCDSLAAAMGFFDQSVRVDFMVIHESGTKVQELDSLRSRGAAVPPAVFVGTARDPDMIEACLSKPFIVDFLSEPVNPHELKTKLIRALSLKRPSPIGLSAAASNEYRREIRLGERAVQLTPTEFSIWKVFAKSSNGSVSKVQLSESIWGPMNVVEKTLDVHLCHFRRKLRKVGIQLSFDHRQRTYSLFLES